jgi:hypothetical protein
MRGFFNPLAQAPLASLVDGKRDSCHRSRSSTTPDTAVSPGWACSPPRDWVTTNGPADAAEHNRLQSYAASVAWAGELVSNATGTCCKICARESPCAGGVPEAVSASPVSTLCQCRGAAGGRCRRWRSPLVAEQVNVAMFEDFPILVPPGRGAALCWPELPSGEPSQCQRSGRRENSVRFRAHLATIDSTHR